jgi:hypothetical protein
MIHCAVERGASKATISLSMATLIEVELRLRSSDPKPATRTTRTSSGGSAPSCPSVSAGAVMDKSTNKIDMSTCQR